MPTAELLYVGLDDGVLGVVDILDEHLSTVRSVVLRAGTEGLPVELPPGRYVAQGWLPSGELVRASFTAAEADHAVVELLCPSGPKPIPHDGWVRVWEYAGSRWVPGPRPQVVSLTPATVSVELADTNSRCRALQTGGEIPVIAVVPPYSGVQVEWLEGTQWRVRVVPGPESSLLDYLHRGDLASAHVVADALMAAPQAPLGEMAIAYYQVQTGHHLAQETVARLYRDQPDAVTAAVLNATLARRNPDFDPNLVTDELLHAAAGGLPVLRGVLQMLIDGLQAAGTERARAEAIRLRRYLGTATIDSPFTIFTGATPATPGGSYTLPAPIDPNTVFFGPSAGIQSFPTNDDSNQVEQLLHQALITTAGSPLDAINVLRSQMFVDDFSPFAPAILVNALVQRLPTSGSANELADAIDLGERILSTADKELRTVIAASLGVAYLNGFELHGRLADINRSIDLFRFAAASTDSPSNQLSVADLAGALHTRYRYTRQLNDLNDAISYYSDAVDGIADNSRLEVHANLADALLDLYQRTQDQSVLWQASDVATTVVEQTPERDAAFPGRLFTLAAIRRVDAASDPLQMAEVIGLYTRVADLSSPEDPGTVERIFSLVRLLLYRNSEADVTRAHRWATELTHRTQPNTPAYAKTLVLLGDVLRAQGEPTRTVYRTAAQTLEASSLTRVQAAVRWAQAAADEHDGSEALRAWATAIDAVVRLASVGIDIETREHLLATWATVPREAAAHAIAAGDPMAALEFLEAGRTVLWNQSIDLRGDFSTLAERHPEIAQRLTELTKFLNHSDERDRDTAVALAGEWEELITHARSLPGFERFLQRPSADELVKALGDRIVVVLNAASTRCDALVVSGAGIRVVPLSVRLDEIVAMAANMQASAHQTLPRVMAVLWDVVVRPVLDALALPRGTRLWWCPTGPFTMLPVHAAGTANDSVFHRVVPSYTATVTTLVQTAEPADTGGLPTFVGVDHLPDSVLPDLPAVVREALTFRAAVRRSSYEIFGEDATRAAVRAAASHAPLLHLACHAQPSPEDPRSAGLELWDGRLTVRELADAHMTAPHLVYLSACHTAVGDSELPDEVISIAAAFLVAGSRNVIGTLWDVSDQHASSVARIFYSALATSADPARALHTAVTALREKYPQQPSIWAPYVHMGSGMITDDLLTSTT